MSSPIEFPAKYSVPSVLKLLDTTKKIIILYGWRDGGKSTSLGNILVTKLLFDKHFRGVHIRKDYNDIHNSTFQNLKDRVNQLGVNKYIRVLNDHAQVINSLRPSNYLFGAGSNKPDKLRSTQDLNIVWFEEFHDATQLDYESIMGTIREKKGFETKFIGTLNNDKVVPNGFIHNTFFKESSPIWDDIELIHVSWRDNQFIDKEKTEKKLRLAVLNNDEKFNILDKGGFIQEGGSKYYTEFSERCLYENLEISNNCPIILTFDFNYDPTTSVLMQNDRLSRSGLIAHKEFIVTGGTRALCNEIKNYLHKKGLDNLPLRITGDASGHSKSSKSGQITDYNVIQEVFKIPKSWINHNNKKNMELGLSRDLINEALHYDLIKINKNECQNLVSDLRRAKPDESGTKLFKDTDQYGMHLHDAFKYGFLMEFPDHLSIRNY